MKRTQRWISLFLCIALIVAALPIQALASSRALTKSRSIIASRHTSKTYADVIKPGDFLVLGTYNGHPLLWTVVNSAGGEITLFCSEVLFEGEIDASMHEVIAYANLVGGAWEGDSNWHTSDIRNYLNSNDTTVSYKGASQNELPSYSALPGFLTNFTNEEVDLILDTTHRSHIHYHRTLTDKDGGNAFARVETFPNIIDFNEDGYKNLAYINTTEKFFLPDAMDLKQANANIGSMMYMEYAYDDVNYCHYAPAYRDGFWLREPVISGSNYLFWGIYFLDTRSSNGAGYATFKRGIRPMCCIQLPYKQSVSGEGTLESPYQINYGDNEAQKVQKPHNIVVPNGKYCICVVDENGQPLKDASVNWTVNWSDSTGITEEQFTDEKGCVYFDRLTADLPLITVEKDDYIKWTNVNTNWQKSEDHYETVVLYPEAYGSYKLKEARFSANNLVWTWDLLTKTKKRTLGTDADLVWDANNATFYLSCSAYETDQIAFYELWQKDQLIATSQDGLFEELSNEQFSEGGECFVRVITKDNNSVDTAINLEFVKVEINKYTSVDILSDKVAFKVGDNIPYLGGSTVEFEWPITVPVTAVYADGKIQLGFNVNMEGGKSDAEKIKDVKELITKASNLKDAFTKQNYAKYLSLVHESSPVSFFGDAEVNLLGYAELEPGSTVATGYIILEMEASLVEFGYDTLVPAPPIVIPVTVQAELSSGMDVRAGVTYDWENATFRSALTFNPWAELEAFGGVGAKKIAGVGAYGSALLETEIKTKGTPKGLQYIDLTGELGIKAYLGPFSGEKPIAYDTWHIYSSNSVQLLTLDERAKIWDSIFDAAAYQKQDLSYLAEESQWLGEENFIEPLAANVSGAKTAFKDLLQNTYRNAQPVVAATEDAIYLAFLHANSETGSIYVVTAKYDGENWVGTVQADANALLDDAPSLCVDKNGTIHLAYARTDSSFDGESLLSYAENQSIVVGTLDPNTLEFTETKTFSAEGYANKQQLVLVDGTPMLVWLDSAVSDDNSVLFPDSADFCCAEYRSEKWSESTVLTSVDQPVLSMVPGEVDLSLAVAYVADTDGDPATTDDYTLYEVTDTDTTELASGVTGKIAYDVFPGTNVNTLLWNDGSHLYSAQGAEVAVSGITNEYVIVNNRIYYSAAEEDCANLCVIQYENNNWSLPMTLTDEDRYLENLSVTPWNGEDYVLGMHTFATIYSDTIIDLKNLVWSKIVPVNDLKLESVEYDANSLQPDSETELSLSIVNAGENIVEDIDIFIDDALVSTESCDLYPGESIEIAITVECPNVQKTYDVSVAESGVSDYTPEDNSFAVKLGYSDISIAMVYEQIGEHRAALAYITNKGVDVASGRVAFYDDNHYFMDSSKFTDLPVGETIVVTCILSDAFLGNGDIDISAEVICDADDLYGYNNVTTVHVGEIVYATEVQFVTFDGKTAATLITCAPDSHNTALLAAYGASGQMLEIYSCSLDEGANLIEQTMESEGIVSVRVFLLNNHYVPQYPAMTALNITGFRAEFAEALTSLTYSRYETSLDVFVDGEYIDEACADAVLRMFNLGLMLGDDRGIFDPKSAITRAELAQIIYTALNGGVDDGATIYTNENLFSDVTAEDWYAGYCNYCATQKIGSTQSNTYYRPLDPVTTVEAAEMILCAMGYSAETCGFVGDNWLDNVLTAASSIGLLEGFNYSTNTYIPRQWLAVMFCNAIDNA